MTNQLIVYEHLTVWSLLKSKFLRQKVCFFSASFLSRWLIETFQWQQQYNFLYWQRGHIRDQKGQLMIDQIYSEVGQFCLKIDEAYWKNNAFIQLFDSQRMDVIRNYLCKELFVAIEQRLYLINFLKTYKNKHTMDRVVFYIRENLCFPELKAYAKRKGIDVVASLLNVKELISKLKDILGYGIVFPLQKFWQSLVAKNQFQKKNNETLIASFYNLADITTDKTQRSAIFLFLNQRVPLNRLLIYFEHPGRPCSEQMAEEMDRLGIQYVAFKDQNRTSTRVPVWSVRKRFWKIFLQRQGVLMKNLLRRFCRGQFNQVVQLPALVKFNSIYAFHRDFFQSCQVKINIGVENFSSVDAPKWLALQDAGGVRLCYQVSNSSFAHMATYGALTDVYFNFGPYYNEFLRRSASMVKDIVPVGYITDYSFEPVIPNARLMRQQLLEQGARFVIGFFDESFGDGDAYTISRQTANATHEWLAQLVLESSDIAVIHKPKKIDLSPFSPKVKEAIKTGRYILLDTGRYLTHIFPAQVAQSSDVTIGLLIGGTTSLESWLCAVPSFYYDPDRLYSFVEYSFGKNRLVFDNLPQLKEAIDQFKKDKASLIVPAAFNALLNQKDPFRDGKAADRINIYLNWLLEKLDSSATRQEALDFARQQYEATYIKGKPNPVKNQISNAYCIS